MLPLFGGSTHGHIVGPSVGHDHLLNQPLSSFSTIIKHQHKLLSTMVVNIIVMTPLLVIIVTSSYQFTIGFLGRHWCDTARAPGFVQRWGSKRTPGCSAWRRVWTPNLGQAQQPALRGRRGVAGGWSLMKTWWMSAGHPNLPTPPAFVNQLKRLANVNSLANDASSCT